MEALKCPEAKEARLNTIREDGFSQRKSKTSPPHWQGLSYSADIHKKLQSTDLCKTIPTVKQIHLSLMPLIMGFT